MLRYSVISCVLPVLAAIFNLPLAATSESFHILPAVLLDPENVGVAFENSLSSLVRTSWDIRISSLQAAVLDFPLLVFPCDRTLPLFPMDSWTPKTYITVRPLEFRCYLFYKLRYNFKFWDRHLGFFISGCFQFGRTTLTTLDSWTPKTQVLL